MELRYHQRDAIESESTTIVSQTKICSKCKIEKNVSEFHKRGKGYKSRCKECRKEENPAQNERAKIYQKNNPEKVKESNRKYRTKVKDKMVLYKKDYYQKNKKEIDIKNKEYVLKNKDKIMLYQKEYRNKNKKELREQKNKRKKLKYHNDSEYKIKERISCLFRIQLNALNIKKNYSLFKYTGVDRSLYVEHLKKSPLWKDFLSDKDIDIDHIIPVSAYDFNNELEIKKCWDVNNLRLLPSIENRIIKKDKIDFELVEKYNIKHLLPEGLKQCLN